MPDGCLRGWCLWPVLLGGVCLCRCFARVVPAFVAGASDAPCAAPPTRVRLRGVRVRGCAVCGCAVVRCAVCGCALLDVRLRGCAVRGCAVACGCAVRVRGVRCAGACAGVRVCGCAVARGCAVRAGARCVVVRLRGCAVARWWLCGRARQLGAVARRKRAGLGTATRAWMHRGRDGARHAPRSAMRRSTQRSYSAHGSSTPAASWAT